MASDAARAPVASRLALATVLFAGLLYAEDAELPDMEFLEYLGSWEESDEDWMLFAEEASAKNTERNDPAPEGSVPHDEESTEKDDES